MRELHDVVSRPKFDRWVTGDADLLVLDPFRGIRIMTPTDFLGLGETAVTG